MPDPEPASSWGGGCGWEASIVKRLTKTVALRLTPHLHRQIVREQVKGETLSDTIRRLLSQSVVER